MRPLSNDLRERVVGAVNGGESCRSVAARFGVAASTVVKWSQRYRATGSVMPGKVGGHRKPVLDAHRAFIRQRIDQTSHLTLHKLKDELAARGVVVSHNAVWTFVRREGLSFKKTLFALEQARADVARQRRRWQALQAGLDPRRQVFIDETWIKTNMAPLRGWAPKGQRLRGFAPYGRWRTLTFLSALRWDGITAPCIFDGPINGQCFRAYVPVIDPRFSYRGEDVVQALDKVCTRIGYPTMIRVDQGTEFVSRDLDLWAHTRGVVLDFSRPGKPTDNAFMEAFNGRFASISTCSSTLKMLGKRWRLSAGTAMRSARHGAIGQKAPITLLARDGIPSPPS